MAGDWIKMEHVTQDKPEVFKIASLLKIDVDSVLGKLVRLWVWADQQTIIGNAPSVTKTLLDHVARIDGFADAMFASGWLIWTNEGAIFPNFDRHNGQTAKTRALAAKRTQKHRGKCNDESVTPSRFCNDESVTESLPEKRREENRREEAAAPQNSCARAPQTAEQPTPPKSDDVTPCNANNTQVTPLSATPVEGFEDFWQAYPRKKSKKEASAAWKELRPSAELAGVIVAAVDRQKRTLDWKRESGRYIPMPTKWLNGHCWLDEQPNTRESRETESERAANLKAQRERARQEADVERSPKTIKELLDERKKQNAQPRRNRPVQR